MIDPELTGMDGHLVRQCPRCYAHTIRVACPVLGAVHEDYTVEDQDVYDCPTCGEVTRMPCPAEELA